VQPAKYSRPDGERYLAFQGDADSLSFTSMMPRAVRPSGLYALVLKAAPHRGKLQLIVQWHSYDPWAGGLGLAGEAEPTALIDGIERVKIEYFGSDDVQSPPSWRPTWNSPERLPLLIKLSVTFPAEDRRRWPDLVVRPMIEGMTAAGK
jgi:hypothetical protein